MTSLYNQTMAQVSASDDLKQKTTDMLLEKMNELSEIKPIARIKKAFKARYIIAAATAAVLVFCAIFIPLMLMNDEIAILDERPGLAWGYNDFEPSNSFYCAYKSDKTEFDIDDITLTFYYATISGMPQESDFKIHNIDLFFIDGNNGGVIPDYELCNDSDAHFIKEIEDFYNEQLRRREVINDKYSLTHKFPFFEQITIPKTIFKQQKGMIYFVFREYERVDESKQYGDGGGAPIYYKLNGQNVILSINPIN